ncbi:HNH endonuclease family protein [Naasia sp. SYSU D00948]|uniref:HNH endonuclease family protein n=1 Tax=Naasia sp. SYSU D00948 TaxID=2817379 RepID=UPI0027DE9D66|nr:HNH endonuclease family protein [Naasia sp. SYSU D00948]
MLGALAAVLLAAVVITGGNLPPVLAGPADPSSAVTPAPPIAPPAASPSAGPSSIPSSSLAVDVLATLEVKGRAPKTGYDREEDFGTAWLDVDRNGCDTRNDILQRDLDGELLSGPCKVLSGTLSDPFTGRTISFVRGEATSSLVQIDHVVALMDAWQKGAQQLTQEERIRFANDPLNLLAVDGSANSQKGDGDAATWLPANRPFRCEYVARQVAVKAAYRLWVTAAERDAIARVLDTCPGQTVPVP